MDAALYQNIVSQGGVVDLSARAKWRLSGADRVRYLNGQVTNDVRLAKSDAALYACVTNVKGKIEGDVFIHVDGESLILDAPAALRESLGMRLEKYIIADDAILEDIMDDWQLWHYLGTETEGVSSHRFGLPGTDVWLPASQSATVTATLSADDAEAFRILQRVPASPNELNLEAFPQEAGLEKAAMSYTKGCYIGQEILSRIKTTGKMPRELIAWEAVGAEAGITPGASLYLGERAVGTITSQTRHPVTEHLVGLAFIRQGLAAADSVLLVGDGVSNIAATVKISALLNQ
jgi:folate-binding protein YgfZ